MSTPEPYEFGLFAMRHGGGPRPPRPGNENHHDFDLQEHRCKHCGITRREALNGGRLDCVEERARPLVNLERYLRFHPNESGTIPMPFKCHLCDRDRFDLDLVDGDGNLICTACIDETAELLR